MRLTPRSNAASYILKKMRKCCLPMKRWAKPPHRWPLVSRRSSYRALSLLLIVLLVGTSVPAAPKILVGLASEWRLDLIFWISSSGWSRSLKTLVGLQEQPAPANQETQQERDNRVTRIEINPGSATLKIGEHLYLMAIAYDAANIPVGGVKFNWQNDNPAQAAQGSISSSGEFTASLAGEYGITVEGAGKTAHFQISVWGSNVPPGNSPEATQIRNVSLNDLSTVASTFKKTSVEQEIHRKRTKAPSNSTKSSLNHILTPLPASPMLQSSLNGDPYGWNINN